MAYIQNAESLDESIVTLERKISEMENILHSTDTMDSSSLMSQL